MDHHNNPIVSDEPVQNLDADKHRRMAARGRWWLCAGVGFMGLSFGINFLAFNADHAFDIPMYVLTSLGMACIVKSMADLLGF